MDERAAYRSRRTDRSTVGTYQMCLCDLVDKQQRTNYYVVVIIVVSVSVPLPRQHGDGNGNSNLTDKNIN